MYLSAEMVTDFYNVSALFISPKFQLIEQMFAVIHKSEMYCTCTVVKYIYNTQYNLFLFCDLEFPNNATFLTSLHPSDCVSFDIFLNMLFWCFVFVHALILCTFF